MKIFQNRGSNCFHNNTDSGKNLDIATENHSRCLASEDFKPLNTKQTL
jgi:hypothetical protein